MFITSNLSYMYKMSQIGLVTVVSNRYFKQQQEYNRFTKFISNLT